MIVIDIAGDGEETTTKPSADADEAERLRLERERYLEWLQRSPTLQIITVETDADTGR